MKLKYCIFVLYLITAWTTFIPAQAISKNTDILKGVDVGITNGYRQDKIFNSIKSFTPSGTLLATDVFKAERMILYQTGVIGKYSKCGFVVHGEADWGWGTNGKYREKVIVPEIASSSSKAAISSLHTQDYTVGAGYQLDLGQFTCLELPGLSIGPMAGWSYNRQQFKIKHAITEGVINSTLNGLKFTEHWEGPWLGFNATWNYCMYILNIGYEYHWANWRGTWTLAGPDSPTAFSDRRKSNDAHGQVGYVEGKWFFCSGWTFGIGLKYQVWKTSNGRERPAAGSFAVLGLPDETDKIKEVEWESFAATLNLGYVF